MRAFLTACAVIVIVAEGTMLILDFLVQRSASATFAKTGARV